MSRNRSVQALTDAARQRSTAAEQAVQKALRQARKDNTPITVTGLAAAAGVSTDFIYRHPALRAQVEALRRTRRAAPSAQSNATDVEAASSTLVRRLSQQLADARRTHHQEVTELRKALEVAHGELLTLRRKLDDAARGDRRVGDSACQSPCCARRHP
ncbi:DUF6262 family protein [Streptomyces sp. NPDC001401]|uniref:DUF6262 family protein n=1 Tax=Streptomyces sp. NPDC001401 TaxID=3364570 RepID=UPI0036901984